MLKVGLTGGIASGKTTVSQLLGEKGVYHIDFDTLAHDVQKKGTPIWAELVAEFGPSILHDDGTINRARLGDMVFKDRTLLSRLNEIVHPAVISEWEKICQQIARQDAEAIILNDVPLLIEAGLQHLFDFIILVYIPPEVQIRRLMERNGLTEEEARIRLEAQLPIQEKVAFADIVFDNSIPYPELEQQVQSLWKELIRRAGKHEGRNGESWLLPR